MASRCPDKIPRASRRVLSTGHDRRTTAIGTKLARVDAVGATARNCPRWDTVPVCTVLLCMYCMYYCTCCKNAGSTQAITTRCMYCTVMQTHLQTSPRGWPSERPATVAVVFAIVVAVAAAAVARVRSSWPKREGGDGYCTVRYTGATRPDQLRSACVRFCGVRCPFVQHPEDPTHPWLQRPSCGSARVSSPVPFFCPQLCPQNARVLHSRR